MISPRFSTHNQKAKLAADYNDLLKELSSPKMKVVGCYSIGETVGEGTYGKVKLGVHQITGRQVAIKKISKQHAPLMAREIHHHRQLRHPNIVTLFEILSTESAIYIVCEYCPNGELFDLLTTTGRFSEQQAQFFFRQLVDAVRYCHERGIVHRDLKLENILLDAENNCKICDFGFARQVDDKQMLETFCGSLAYSAPEVIKRQRYTGPETDIWSLGIILYTLLAGELPFDDDNEAVMQRKIVNVDYEIPSYFSPEARDLISRILRLDPQSRLTIEQIVNHPWMTMIMDDDDCGSVPSARYSGSSDVDSLFSSPRQAPRGFENDYDICTEISSTRSSLIKSPTKAFHNPADALQSSRRWNDVMECNFNNHSDDRHGGGLLQQDKSRYASRPPRFSAPTVSSRMRMPQYPSTVPCRSSLPNSLPSHTKMMRDSLNVPEEPAMAPIEQRLFSALTAAGFDERTVRNMRSADAGNALGTLWHMLMDNLSKSESCHSPVTVSTSLSTKSTPAQASCKQVDKGIQTEFESDVIVRPTVSEPLVPNTPITSSSSSSLPKPTIPPSNSNNTNRSERPGWFSSVKAWFGNKHEDGARANSDNVSISSRSSSHSKNSASNATREHVVRFGSDSKQRRQAPADGVDKYKSIPVPAPPTIALPAAVHNKPSLDSYYKASSAYGPARPPMVLTSQMANNLPVAATRPNLPPTTATPVDVDACRQGHAQSRPRPPAADPPAPVQPRTAPPVPAPKPTQSTPRVELKPAQPEVSVLSSSEEEDDDDGETSDDSSPATSVSSTVDEPEKDSKLKVSPLPTPTRSWPMAFRDPPPAKRFEFAAPRSQLGIYTSRDGGRRKPLGAKIIIEEEDEEEE